MFINSMEQQTCASFNLCIIALLHRVNMNLAAATPKRKELHLQGAGAQGQQQYGYGQQNPQVRSRLVCCSAQDGISGIALRCSWCPNSVESVAAPVLPINSRGR